MRILLLGEYSNVHATLAKGLREMGHEVTVVSNGDFWKDYPRDIDVSRPAGRVGGLRLLARVYALLPRLKGYDIVQLINPMFLELKARRLFPVYRYLRRHNRKVVLCAMGMDYYWVNECLTRRPLRYSDFNIGQEWRTDAPAMEARRDWLATDKEKLNRMMAHDCDAIVAGLYEYYVCYQPHFADKLQFIPLPIVSPASSHPSPLSSQFSPLSSHPSPLTSHFKLRLFIGISRGRSAYKGTDIMLRAAEAVGEKYPDRMEIVKAEGVPFAEYQQLMDGSDAILDQLYSYTPSMNPLLAMSKGIVCIGGGEPESYDILGEQELRPIVNVQPSYESVFHELEQLVLHPERLPLLKRQSIEYVSRHHDYLKVAAQYVALYEKLLCQ
ncbi:MAG: glycosyltransferase family 1 protein [Prevotella sp.]|nr:glycosyltransferase family 1 protein [Prevotella sp.]